MADKAGVVIVHLQGDTSSGRGYNVLLTVKTGRQMDFFLGTDEFAQVEGDEESRRDPAHIRGAVQVIFDDVNKSMDYLHLPNSNYIGVENRIHVLV